MDKKQLVPTLGVFVLLGSSICTAVPADLDNDGIPNAIESDVGLNANDASDAGQDLDTDGWSNLDEYRFGTEIDNQFSHPGVLYKTKHQKVFASDAVANHQFGGSLSISGDTALIGAAGSAYVFTRDNNGLWTEQTKLTASGGEASDQFGKSVSISGDTALIGAYGEDDNGLDAGGAYVFVRDNNGLWIEQAKLYPSDGVAGDQFGHRLTLAGDTALISTYRHNPNGTTTGSVYVFNRDAQGGWAQQAELTADDELDQLGNSLSLSGNTALIGAYWIDDDWGNPGSAYVFSRDTDGLWTQQAKLTASDGAAADLFGHSLSLSGDTALIGAAGDNDNGLDSGSAYVFTRDSDGLWTEQAKLKASDGAEQAWFGRSLSLSGDRALIGAHNDGDNGVSSGSAYVFSRENNGLWTERAKLNASDGAESDRFGWSVALSGDSLLVSAPYDNDNGYQSGTAYLFDLPTAAPLLKATPSRVNLGLVELGETVNRSISISNLGDADLLVNHISVEMPFQLVNHNCFDGALTAASNAMCTVNLTFTATTEGESQGGLEIGSNDPGVDPVIPLSATVVAPAIATASSVENNDSQHFDPAFAIDGDLSTRWSSAFSDREWLAVDLGMFYRIDQVVIHWERAYGKAYQIQVSDNGSDWRTLFQENNSDGGQDIIDLDTVVARYVRMKGLRKATRWGYSIQEFDVVGEPVGLERVLIDLSVSPANSVVELDDSLNFEALGLDQFGDPIAVDLNWWVSGGGIIDQYGRLTATSPGGPFVVTASSKLDGTIFATAQFSVTGSDLKNLALAGTLTASSVEGNDLERFAPEFAADADLNTRWSSSFSDNQWLMVDLGAQQAFNQVEIHWEAAYGKAYAIQISDDGNNWQTLYTELDSNGGLDALDLGPTVARYVRIQGIERATKFGYSIFEFKIY